ncbi:MAG: hypothetical protein ACI8ZN_002239, partial [Bacteroidia bacterium]
MHQSQTASSVISSLIHSQLGLVQSSMNNLVQHLDLFTFET